MSCLSNALQYRCGNQRTYYWLPWCQWRRTAVRGHCINLSKYNTFRAMSHSTGGAFPNLSTFGAIRSPPERCLHGDIAFQVIRVDIPPKPIVRVLWVILSFNNVRRGPNQSANWLASRIQAFPNTAICIWTKSNSLARGRRRWWCCMMSLIRQRIVGNQVAGNLFYDIYGEFIVGWVCCWYAWMYSPSSCLHDG